jgi:proteasome lid subunit RPN8/RPN11
MTDNGEAAEALAIDAATWDAILAHLRGALPNEGVGLLATDRDSGRRRATRFFPGTNVDASPSRFTMDPAEVIETFQAMRESGWALGAIVHSHPATEPAPSATDAREAYYPDALLLIVSFAGPDPAARVWKCVTATGGRAATFAESALEIGS